MPSTIPRVSYSAKSSYDTCPRAFRYGRVEHVKPDFPPHISAIMGRAVHETVSIFYKREQFELVSLLGIWPEQFQKHLDREKYEFHAKQKFEKCIKVGEDILTSFYTTAKKNGLLIKPIKTEWRGEVIVTSKSWRQYRIGFVLDLVIVRPDGTVAILDLKSGTRQLTQKEVDSNEQLTIYSLGLRKVLGLVEKHVGLFYLRTGTILLSTRTEGDYEKIIEAIDQDWQKIEREEFEPTYKGCMLCPFSRRCEAEDLASRIGVNMVWVYRSPK